MWLLHSTKLVLDVSISILLVLYAPYVAILFMSYWFTGFLTSQRQRALGIIPIVWGGTVLMFNAAELAMIGTYLGIKSVSDSIVKSVGEIV